MDNVKEAFKGFEDLKSDHLNRLLEVYNESDVLEALRRIKWLSGKKEIKYPEKYVKKVIEREKKRGLQGTKKCQLLEGKQCRCDFPEPYRDNGRWILGVEVQFEDNDVYETHVFMR